jgi:hypothetical protein
MMRLNWKTAFLTAFIGVLLLTSTLPAFVSDAQAQTAAQSYVAVTTTAPSTTMYTAVGQNWTLSFKAEWAQGNQAGQTIQNASVIIQVTSTTKNEIVDGLELNTTAGTFTFNYSSATADILKFNATELVTEDGTTYDSSAFGGGSVAGLQSDAVTVWYDAFHVSLVSSNTDNWGTTEVTVNVTYLLLPEEGLTLPESATYSHQTFLPKAVHGADVTINGVQAQESEAGIYTASVSTWFSTAYIHVGVSQEGWTTTHKGFSFVHNANGPLWLYGVLIASALVVALFGFRYASLRRTKQPKAFKQSFPFFGGILLAVVSFISLYWALVGVEGTLHGFDWLLLAALGLLSFGLGITGAVLSLKQKNQAFILFAMCLPLIANLVPIQSSLESYQLAVPWLSLMAALVIAIASVFLISNADEQFNKKPSKAAELNVQDS